MSQALTYTAAVVVTVLLFVIPTLSKFCVNVLSFMGDGSAENISLGAVTANLYVAMIPAYLALFTLSRLLKNIKADEIFIEKNVSYLRILSYCCFAETLIFLCLSILLGVSFTILMLSFAAAFFGLILRVIKNVFDKAIEIREENDYTI